VEAKLHTFLTSALVGCEWLALRLSSFTPRARVPNAHWIGGWVGPGTGLDALEKRKSPIIAPSRNWRVGRDMEVVGPIVRYISSGNLEGLKKTTKTPIKIASFRAEIQIWHFPYTKQGCHHFGREI
jgi:hypothetical protein